MALTLRDVFETPELTSVVRALTTARWQAQTACVSGAIGNGTTNGKLRTTAAITYRIAGTLYTKASTDDLWDLSALTALGSTAYQAVILFLNSSGTASITACTSKTSVALALAEVEANLSNSKAVIGIYGAGNSTDFTAALASQGQIWNGLPDDCFAYSAPITIVAP